MRKVIECIQEENSVTIILAGGQKFTISEPLVPNGDMIVSDGELDGGLSLNPIASNMVAIRSRARTHRD